MYYKNIAIKKTEMSQRESNVNVTVIITKDGWANRQALLVFWKFSHDLNKQTNMDV